MGIFEFATVAVVFGTLAGVIRIALLRGRTTVASSQMNELLQRMASLEAAVQRPLALPVPDERRVNDLEHRLQALETIVTGADELLERRLQESAQQKLLTSK